MQIVPIPELASRLAALLVAVSALIAALFAIHKFKIGREAEAILELDLSLHNVPASNLFDVSICVKNIGKAAAYLSKGDGRRALIMVRKISHSENHTQLVWEKFEDQRLIDDIEYITSYGANVPRSYSAHKESPTTNGWRARGWAIVRQIRTVLTFVDQLPGYIYTLLYLFALYGKLAGNEYAMIYEPASVNTHHVFFSTDYDGPIWIRVELFYERKYWLLRSTTEYKRGCDRVFELPRC